MKHKTVAQENNGRNPSPTQTEHSSALSFADSHILSLSTRQIRSEQQRPHLRQLAFSGMVRQRLGQIMESCGSHFSPSPHGSHMS